MLSNYKWHKGKNTVLSKGQEHSVVKLEMTQRQEHSVGKLEMSQGQEHSVDKLEMTQRQETCYDEHYLLIRLIWSIHAFDSVFCLLVVLCRFQYVFKRLSAVRFQAFAMYMQDSIFVDRYLT